MPTKTYKPIATVTLGSSASDITFSSIPGTYTDLVLVFNGTNSGAANLNIQVNSDTGTNYSFTAMYGTGSSYASNRGTSTTYLRAGYITTSQSGSVVQFQNYSSSAIYKTLLARQFVVGGDVESSTSLWRNTAAITSIKVYPSSGTFASGSTATIYGIE